MGELHWVRTHWREDPNGKMGETFEMVLKTKKLLKGTKKVVIWAEDGGEKFAGM